MDITVPEKRATSANAQTCEVEPGETKEQRLRLKMTLAELNAIKIEDGIALAPRSRQDKAGRTWPLGEVAGKIVRQLWHREGTGELEDFWIHKTKREWREEAACSEVRLRTAVRVLVEEGLIETMPGYRGDRRQTTFYRLNLWRVLQVLAPARAADIEPELRGLDPDYTGDRVQGETGREGGEGVTDTDPQETPPRPSPKCTPTPPKLHPDPHQSATPTRENSRENAVVVLPEGADAPEEATKEAREELPANAMTRLTVSRTKEVGFDPAQHQKNNWGQGWKKFIYVAEGETPPTPEEQFAVLNEIVSAASGKSGKPRYFLSVEKAVKRVEESTKDRGDHRRSSPAGSADPAHQGSMTREERDARRQEGIPKPRDEQPARPKSDAAATEAWETTRPDLFAYLDPDDESYGLAGWFQGLTPIAHEPDAGPSGGGMLELATMNDLQADQLREKYGPALDHFGIVLRVPEELGTPEEAPHRGRHGQG